MTIGTMLNTTLIKSVHACEFLGSWRNTTVKVELTIKNGHLHASMPSRISTGALKVYELHNGGNCYNEKVCSMSLVLHILVQDLFLELSVLSISQYASYRVFWMVFQR